MKFEINETSMKIYIQWEKKHDKTCPYLKIGSAGGRTSFVFTPTGLGIQITVKCACGKWVDITDINEW